jgi:hypothetical protein
MERLQQLVGSWSAPNPADLMVWELTHTCGHAVRRTQHQDHKEWNLYSTYECQECGGEIRGVINAVRIGSMPEVERRVKPVAGQAPTGPKTPSKAALRRRLREAEAQANALRVQLAQLDEATGTRRPG